MIDGKRAPFTPGVKICASNAEAVALYTEDRLKALRAAVKADPDAPRSFAVSVEPSDGGGHCECAECAKIGSGSVSDRVFYLANHVARAVEKEFPGQNRHVSLYAYFQHAAVPTIPIEPNVYVVAVPYGLQFTGLSGDELLAAWSEKVLHLGVYDYWSITDWTNDLPDFDVVRKPRQRIDSWRENRVDGVMIQSSNSAGAIGLGWYVSSRLLWDPKRSEQEIRDEFYDLSFGPAREPMQRILERWAADFNLMPHELGLSYLDLIEARSLASGDEAVLARIADYERYAHYLRLWSEYQQAPKGEARQAAGREVVDHAWRIYDSAMVHSFRMWQLIASRYEKDAQLSADFDPKKPEAPGWNRVSPLSDDALAALMQDGADKYQPLDIEARRFGQEVKPLRTDVSPSTRFSPPITMATPATFEFEVKRGVSEVMFRFRGTSRETAPDTRLTAYDPKGERMFTHTLAKDGKQHELTIATPKPGRYRLEVFDQKAMYTVEFPPGVPLVTRSFLSTALSPRVYFYVPRGLKRIAMYSPGVLPLKFEDGDGNSVDYEPAGPQIVLDVPEGQDCRVWSLREFKAWSPIKMLNVPQVFSFHPDTMMVPEEE
jgi:hypothetical protein